MGGTPATPPGMRVRTGRFERLSSLTHSRSVLRSCLVASAAPAPTTTTFADFSLRQCRLPFRNKARPPQVRVAHRERRARSGVYLTSGGKNGCDIGETVKSALAPTLTLTYLPKDLVAFRTALGTMGIEVEVAGAKLSIKHCSNVQLYAVLKDATQSAVVLAACSSQPYVWKHLAAFIEGVKTPACTAELIKAHDRRIRWQIERIYRTRCDIVHAGRQVITASLLCANLEFYLRMTLKSMLKGFSNVTTLKGPAEFFERQRHQLAQILAQLQPSKGGVAADTLLVASLD